jgi:hypothetical protein
MVSKSKPKSASMAGKVLANPKASKSQRSAAATVLARKSATSRSVASSPKSDQVSKTKARSAVRAVVKSRTTSRKR